MPDLSIENKFKWPVCGVDEVGRGPWAGPVTACAVILNLENIPQGLNDSKKLSLKRRESLYAELYESGAEIGIGSASVAEIDAINILQASKLAMQRAVAELAVAPAVALIDGNQPVELPCQAVPVVKGDSKSLSIAAASIVAKVTRDRLMVELAKEHPHYGWERNAGYGTAQHQQGLAEYGLTKHHRNSFAPIRKLAEALEAASA